MKKDDIKAFFLIFFIIVLITGMIILGIKMYPNIIEKEKIKELFQGIITMSPQKEDLADTSQNDDILNQIESAESQNTKQSKYYYNQLELYSKIIYDKFESNKENLKTGTYQIDFGKTFNQILKEENGTELLKEYYQSAIEAYAYDNPGIFYLDPNKMYINKVTIEKIFTTTYEVNMNSGENDNYLAEEYNNRDEILVAENKIKQETQKIVEKTEGKSDYQKIKIIHDYLVDNISYDKTISKNNIYDIYGALVNKEAVCEGYAKAFKYLMDKVEIECIVVIGDATNSDENTQKHAWNYVKLDNAWYAVDVTWDDAVIVGGTLTKKYKYRYFLKGSETMNKEHIVSNTLVENGKTYELPVLSEKDY